MLGNLKKCNIKHFLGKFKNSIEIFSSSLVIILFCLLRGVNRNYNSCKFQDYSWTCFWDIFSDKMWIHTQAISLFFPQLWDWLFSNIKWIFYSWKFHKKKLFKMLPMLFWKVKLSEKLLDFFFSLGEKNYL